ncbi:hypothetical protein Tco_1459338 [Tanacetum coccineum]
MFEREKLSGSNFNDWFRSPKMVLKVEKKLFVIEQPIPPAPHADFTAQVLAQWNAIYDAHNDVACLMLGSMTPKLHGQLKNSSPYEMLQELKSMFDKQARVERNFAGFVRSYNMHNTRKTIGELHALLIEYEKGKGKGKGNRKDKSYTPKPINPKPYAKENPTKDDACHHCKEVGHCKRNYPGYLSELIKKKKQVGSASSSGF